MKTVVVYKSKSGFTKKYAEWIAKELSAEIFEASRITADMMMDYDTVVYGGGLYAVGINGVKLVTQNLNRLKDKKIIIFATGASSPSDDVVKEIKDKNFTSEQQKYIRFFYLRGGFDYNRLTLFNKGLMNLLKLKIKNKTKLTPDEEGMLAAYEKPVDFTTKGNINDLISYVTKQK